MEPQGQLLGEHHLNQVVVYLYQQQLKYQQGLMLGSFGTLLLINGVV